MNDTPAFRACVNCAATFAATDTVCPVCGRDDEGHGEPVALLSEAARGACDGLGGILAIEAVSGRDVRFVGRCAGGVFGMRADGALVWRQDWGYVHTLEPRGALLNVNGKTIDVDTGGSR